MTDAPDVTIKWRGTQAPYVEIRQGGELLVAGWVCPTPDGPVKGEPVKSNPAWLFNGIGPGDIILTAGSEGGGAGLGAAGGSGAPYGRGGGFAASAVDLDVSPPCGFDP